MKNYSILRLSEAVRIVLCFLISFSSLAQLSKPEGPKADSHSQIKYLFPINPGKPNLLAGTMGELRSTHFHAGIDVRTDNKTGVPVLAAQDGYITRAAVSSYGYGQVLFITHPDGNTTLYAHLDQFTGAIGKHIMEEHYRRKSFELDLFFSPHEFPVKKGDTIALSGNTGGSSGPHLHFEIRNEQNEALNPLQFGFDEIVDNIPPTAQKIALKTMNISSRINDRFGRYEFSLIKTTDGYVLPQPILAYGKIGIELLAFDKLEQGPFRCGINTIETRVDGKLIFVQKIDKINFTETRGILALMDFKSLKLRGTRYNKLYQDDGNKLDYYESLVDEGIINMAEGERKVEIRLTDTYGNVSKIFFTLRPSLPTAKAILSDLSSKDIDYDIEENTLDLSVKIKPKPDTVSAIQIFYRGRSEQRFPSYRSANRYHYLVDLRRILPDSIHTITGTFNPGFKGVVPSGTEYTYYSDYADIYFPAQAVYDTLFLPIQIAKEDIPSYRIGSSLTPLHQSIDITLKNIQLPPKAAVYRSENNRYNYIGGEWLNGHVRFSTLEMGNFVIMQDTIAPAIKKIYAHSGGARFRIRDNLSGISYFEATLNGQWLLMIYDYKSGLLQAKPQDNSKPLKGELILKVVDNAGNENIVRQNIL